MRTKFAIVAAVLAAVVGLNFLTMPAQAQFQGQQVQSVTPLTRDLGAIVTFAAKTSTATVTSADQSGFGVARVVCALTQSTITGSPSTTFKIQNKDGASGLYYDLIVSAAITTSTAPNAIAAGSGMTSVSNVAYNFPLARYWRVSATINGASPAGITGTIGCAVQ